MEKKTFESPKAEVVRLESVHNAKSWNPGNGKDKTGTGNSGGAGNQGNGHGNGQGNGQGNGRGNGRGNGGR